MEAPQSPKKANVRPRSRKSIAHMPTTNALGDKENLTANAAGLNVTTKSTSDVKKSRSKSIGPGGLDALHSAAGNRQKSPPTPQYKSILKPAVPLSPPKPIPLRNVARRSSPSKSRHSATPERAPEGLLIDVSTPTNPTTVSKGYSLPNPFGDSVAPVHRLAQPGSPTRDNGRVAIRTEEDQQAAAKERERQDLIARKDARRKSLANRRVSFAPEATLHTWDVVEMPEDSTTSSASTNATRRASSLSTSAVLPYLQPRSPTPNLDGVEPPSTPPQQVEEILVTASPAHQRDLHQKKRRRSSGIPPMNFNNPNEFSSSPDSAGSAQSGDSNQTSIIAEEDDDSSDTDDKDLVEDETVTEVDREDITARSNGSSSTGSSSRLEEALRQAARQAGTQGIDYDENGDITMEMADEEVTAAFKPWAHEGERGLELTGNLRAFRDQENINPFSPAFKAEVRGNSDEDKEETMDLTHAVGAILPSNGRPVSAAERSPHKAQSELRHNDIVTRRSSGASSLFDDETMDLTLAVGGIQQSQKIGTAQQQLDKHKADSEDEGATMEFTFVVGSGLNRDAGKRRESGSSLSNYEDMDFTVARGRILQSITERTESVDDNTVGMDMTTAIGAILPQQLRPSNTAQAKVLMEREADNGQLSASSLYEVAQKTPELKQPAEARVSEHVRTGTSDSGSPSVLLSEGRGSRRRDIKRGTSVTPSRTTPQSTPLNKPTTPSKQLTSKVAKPITPGKTPPAKNISMRTGSPKKLFELETKQTVPSSVVKAGSTLNKQDAADNSIAKSKVVLKPSSRRSSGLGVDRTGIGSPRVTELLDRRGSIFSNTEAFVVHNQPQANVHFADPQVMEQEVDQERMQDQRRESGLQILQQEADEQDLEVHKDATTNLKDKIESLTPQKKKGKLNGRKSLHVGAAKGLLGKRSAELDNNEDDEDTTPKRLKGMESSPVKKVKLPAPPTKSATTGRVTRSSRVSLGETEVNAHLSTPNGNVPRMKGSRVTTPKDQPRFKDAGNDVSPAKAALFSISQTEHGAAAAFEPPQGEDHVHLQDFLNLTSIRFMELTTTKRRHTIAPNASLDSDGKSLNDGDNGAVPAGIGSDLESCVVAGACTLPVLDLYQHSCRELKKYISEGRTIVREIEGETFEENPPLFREYMTAPPHVKSIMDIQFKNVKTHARLLSKAMWYEWRMKLLDGLKEGLLKNSEGIDADAEILTRQEHLVQDNLPSMTEEQEKLEEEVRDLQAQADELANCDQEELKSARGDLNALDGEIVAKRQVVEDLRSQLAQSNYRVEHATERRQECLAEIEEAEKVRLNSQDWDSLEVSTLQVSVATLEQQYGWAITSAADGTLTMTYKRTLQLYFCPHSFQSSGYHVEGAPVQANANAPISLAYIADAHEYHPHPLTTEKRFFLQIMRAQLQFLEQPKVKVNELLTFVSGGWEKACRIAEEARVLSGQYITGSTILSDESLAVKCVILLREMKTKVEVVFEVGVRSGAGAAGIDIAVQPTARLVYGEQLDAKKIGDFLEQRIGGKRKEKGADGGRWAQAVKELDERLVARGKKL